MATVLDNAAMVSTAIVSSYMPRECICRGCNNRVPLHLCIRCPSRNKMCKARFCGLACWSKAKDNHSMSCGVHTYIHTHTNPHTYICPNWCVWVLSVFTGKVLNVSKGCANCGTNVKVKECRIACSVDVCQSYFCSDECATEKSKHSEQCPVKKRRRKYANGVCTLGNTIKKKDRYVSMEPISIIPEQSALTTSTASTASAGKGLTIPISIHTHTHTHNHTHINDEINPGHIKQLLRSRRTIQRERREQQIEAIQSRIDDFDRPVDIHLSHPLGVPSYFRTLGMDLVSILRDRIRYLGRGNFFGSAEHNASFDEIVTIAQHGCSYAEIADRMLGTVIPDGDHKVVERNLESHPEFADLTVALNILRGKYDSIIPMADRNDVIIAICGCAKLLFCTAEHALLHLQIGALPVYSIQAELQILKFCMSAATQLFDKATLINKIHKGKDDTADSSRVSINYICILCHIVNVHTFVNNVFCVLFI